LQPLYISDPCYFPPVSILEAAVKSANWNWCDTDQYRKHSFRNACYILTAQGRKLLSVPVRKGKSLQLTRDVLISYDEAWQLKHLRALQTAYGNTTFFPHFIDDLTLILEAKPKYLLDLNLSIVHWLLSIPKYRKICFSMEDHMPEGHISLPLDRRNYEMIKVEPYVQLFSVDNFQNNLSILDKLFQDW